MMDDLSPSRLRSFLEYLEKERGCSGATRNHVSPRFTHSRSSSVCAAQNM